MLDRLALGLLDGLDLAHDFALDARLARRVPVVGATPASAEPRAGGEQRAADRVHQAEPRKTGRERDRDQEQREQEQARAEIAESLHQSAADQRAEDAALARRQQRRRGHVQRREPAARDEERDEADQAQRRLERRALDRRRAAQDDGADCEQQQRQRVGDDAQQIEPEIRDPRAERAAEVVDVVGLADVRPARILRAVTQEARQAGRSRAAEGAGRRPRAGVSANARRGGVSASLLWCLAPPGQFT